MKTIKYLEALADEFGTIVKREIDFIRVKPSISTLFLTYRCNSSCKTCTFWKRPAQDEKDKEIGFEEWKVVIDKLHKKGIRVTELFGGNVFLRKDILARVLRYLKEKDFLIHMPTNQIGLDDSMVEVISECVDYLYISTDGVGEYQNKIRGQNGAFQRVEDTISKLIKYRQNGNGPRLICNTTVSKYNVNNLEQIAEYASKSGFDDIMFEYAGEMSQADLDNSKIEGLKPAAYYVKQDESILLDYDNAKLLKGNIKSIIGKLACEDIKVGSVNIDILSVDNLAQGTIPHKKCYVERYEVTVDPSGNVVGCPFFNNYIIGDLVKNSFDDIWNNSRHKKFRSHQNSGKLAMCKHCILGVQRNPSFITSLKRMYYKKRNRLITLAR